MTRSNWCWCSSVAGEASLVEVLVEPAGPVQGVLAMIMTAEGATLSAPTDAPSDLWRNLAPALDGVDDPMIAAVALTVLPPDPAEDGSFPPNIPFSGASHDVPWARGASADLRAQLTQALVDAKEAPRSISEGRLVPTQWLQGSSLWRGSLLLLHDRATLPSLVEPEPIATDLPLREMAREGPWLFFGPP